MSIRYALTLFAAAFIAQPVFAHDDMSSDNKNCTSIVKSCLDAGYTRDGAEGKQFWKDCMKPLMLGKSVSGVMVHEKEVKACRADKIKELKEELNELKAVK